ncbi:predicted protein [Coccidioides posadasii str. Silveira]|uniref:Predicted protein n=1 Tax=Coccidioides posadasii (strain RMSCC 757 / Silveira) TaxID=443226 RepID=E9DJX3_COCPS|nr:predicted protein [Coccidioides posadasii str. Silveira]
MNVEGMNVEGMNVEGMNVEGMNVEGMNVEGMNVEGMNVEGMNVEGMNVEGMGHIRLAEWAVHGAPTIESLVSEIQKLQLDVLHESEKRQLLDSYVFIRPAKEPQAIVLRRKYVWAIIGNVAPILKELDRLASLDVWISFNEQKKKFIVKDFALELEVYTQDSALFDKAG